MEANITTQRNYQDFFRNKSVLELVDTLMGLDRMKPYIELSRNGEVGEFFEKKYGDIPVHSVEDFNSFYDVLNDKIAELGDSNAQVKEYLTVRKYGKELAELPIALSNLEKTLSNFDALEGLLGTVMMYVCDSVLNQSFSMKSTEKGEKISISNLGNVATQISFGMRNDDDYSSIYLIPHHKTETTILHKEAGLIFKKMVEYRVTKTTEQKILDILSFRLLGDSGISRCNSFENDFQICIKDGREFLKLEKTDTNGFIKKLKNVVTSNPEQKIPYLREFLHTFLNLPLIMARYVKKVDAQLKETLDSLNEK